MLNGTRLIAIVALCCSMTSAAFDKPNRWLPSFSPTYPVVPVYPCPNQFATWFPGYPWKNIRGHALSAVNEWFVQGNADIRLRLQSDLPATDLRCTNGFEYNGSVTLTAAQYYIPGMCILGSTSFVDQFPVTLYRGCMSPSGQFSAYNWAPNAEFPSPFGNFDFMEVLTHELGHALGFNHSAVATSVMTGGGATYGSTPRRNLTLDEVLGLQGSGAPYGPIQTTSVHRRADETSLGTWLSEGEPTSIQMFGAPSVDYSTRFEPTSYYLTAFIRAGDNALMWGRTDGVTNWASGFVPMLDSPSVVTESVHPPAVAGDAASPQEVLAYASFSQTSGIVYRTTSDGHSWSSPVALTNQATLVGPAMTYWVAKNVYVIAWPDAVTGLIRTAVSVDNGATFANVQEWTNARSYQRIGVTCQSATQCVLGFADGNKPYTPWTTLHLTYSAVGQGFYVLESSVDGSLGHPSFGGGLDSSSTRTQLGWRDRGSRDQR